MQNALVLLVLVIFFFGRRSFSCQTKRIESMWTSNQSIELCILLFTTLPLKRYLLTYFCICFKPNVVNIETKSRMIKIFWGFCRPATRHQSFYFGFVLSRWTYLETPEHCSVVLWFFFRKFVSTFIFRLFLCHCFISSYFIRSS